MDMHGLGRLESVDNRDRNYPMQALLPRRTSRVWRYWYMNGEWWDQGATGTCVGHAWAHFVEDGPVTHKGSQNIVDPMNIYYECTQVDQWPQNDNGDVQFGTSVRAGAKVLQTKGILSEYRWAWDIDTLTMCLLEAGPVVVGTNWYSSMFVPDNHGFIHIGGSVAGGHAYVLNGINLSKGLIRLKNSWGSWGYQNRGYAFISIKDMERLIGENGEVCIATEVLTRNS